MIKVLISKNRVVSHYVSYKIGRKPFFFITNDNSIEWME